MKYKSVSWMSEQFGLIKNETDDSEWHKGNQPVADDAHIHGTTHANAFPMQHKTKHFIISNRMIGKLIPLSLAYSMGSNMLLLLVLHISFYATYEHFHSLSRLPSLTTIRRHDFLRLEHVGH